MEAVLNGRRPVTAILPTPVTDIAELRLEILSIDNEEVGSLRVDFLGCMKGTSCYSQAKNDLGARILGRFLTFHSTWDGTFQWSFVVGVFD